MKNSIKKRFWKRILELRNDRNLSQEKLAVLANIHRTYISEIERGVTNISLEHIEKLSKALNMDLSNLFKF